MKKTLKICFIAPYLYPYLKGNFPDHHIGGAEFQQQQIIAALKTNAELKVSAITLDYGQQEKETIDAVDIYKSFKDNAGLPLLRFFYPRLYRLWLAMKRADADIYYIRGASYSLFFATVFARLYGCKTVFASAHDTDFEPGKEIIKNVRDLWLYRQGLKRVDAVFCQTFQQAALLKTYYGKPASVIRNFIPAAVKPAEQKHRPAGRTVLWVATIRRFKRAELLLDIAELLPDCKIIIAGGPDRGDEAYFDAIQARAASLPNVAFKGFVPPDQVDRLFDSADVFVNTSIHEGFPNTFLQSWSRGIPVVTYFDPDNLVRDNRLGYTISSVNAAADAIRCCLKESAAYAANIKNYYQAHHGSGVPQLYNNTFNAIAESKV
jgi:glycosyltransferase involved in cell wall biosynthesis